MFIRLARQHFCKNKIMSNFDELLHEKNKELLTGVRPKRWPSVAALSHLRPRSRLEALMLELTCQVILTHVNAFPFSSPG